MCWFLCSWLDQLMLGLMRDKAESASTSACLPFVFELPGLLLCSGFCQLLLNVVDAVQHSSIAWL